MDHNFEKNLEEIKNYLVTQKIPIVRFLYVADNGKIASLTIPTTKIISSTTEKLISILKIKDKALYPDANTLFEDPCSVQENLCIICHFEDDNKYSFNQKINIDVIINFTLINDTSLDIFNDLRNEITIEGIKAGVDINCHYTTDNCIQSFILESNSLLNLADSIQKMKFLIDGIIGSYGQKLNESGNTLILKINKNKIITQSMNINPYILLKNLYKDCNFSEN